MGQDCDLFYPLPEQKEADRSETKIILDIFSNTLNDLPLGNQEQAAKEIFDILYKSNKIQLKGDDRLALLNKIEQPAIQTLHGLREKIKDVAVPLGRSEERVAKILVAIHYELALGYRCVLEDISAKGLLRGGDKHKNADIIRHVIYHLGEILRTKFSVLSNPSGSIWKYIYSLYICAYNNGIHHIVLPISSWCRVTSVEDVFKSILLMSISSPLTMRGNEFNTLYDLAPELTEYIDLGKIQCGEIYSDFMTFNLSGTEPPKKQFASGCDSCSNSANCFAVSTTRLIGYLDEQHEQINEGAKVTPIQRLLNSQTQLERLKSNFSGSERVGNATRTKGGAFQVELVAGFSDAYTFLNKMEDYEDGNEEVGIEEDADEWITLGEESITVEDTADWTTTGIIRAGLRKTSCKVINHSSGGYCLYIDAAEKFHLRVGELVIVKESLRDEWNMAVIIWVSGGKTRTDFGLKLLEGKIATGSCIPLFTKNPDLKIECMFLIDQGESDNSLVRIITPSPDFHINDRLLVNYRGEEHKVTITRINSQTNGYAEYICDWSEQGDTAIEEQRLRPEEKTSYENDFESIWDIL